MCRPTHTNTFKYTPDKCSLKNTHFDEFPNSTNGITHSPAIHPKAKFSVSLTLLSNVSVEHGHASLCMLTLAASAQQQH